MTRPKRSAREKHLMFLNKHAPYRLYLPKGVRPVEAMNWCLRRIPNGNMLVRTYIRNIDRYTYTHNPEGEWASFGDRMWFTDASMAVMFKMVVGVNDENS